MPAKTYNNFSQSVDGICFLCISAELPDSTIDSKEQKYPIESVKLLIDDKFMPHLMAEKWYWDRKQKRCFGYLTDYRTGSPVPRGKIYLQRYIWELETKGPVGKVFMSDPTDFRISQMLHRPVTNDNYSVNTNPILE